MAGPVIHDYGTRSWVAEAACKGMDPGTFHPVEADGAGPAKAVCVRCPVRRPCLDFALATHQEYGVWGGLDEHERRALQRRGSR